MANIDDIDSSFEQNENLNDDVLSVLSAASDIDMLDSSSETSRDEDDFLKDPLANEMQNGRQRLRRVDPICSKLDDFLNSNFLEKTSIFYILLKNAVEYADWSLRREHSPAAQFQWDHEVLEFVETLEYHGQESMVNLLRGSGHFGQGRGGIKSFAWQNWNWPLPGRATRKKNLPGYTTDDGVHSYLLESILKLASAQDCKITPLYEDKIVKVIPVFIAKDAMQIKPGLAFDENQKLLIGSKLRIDNNFVQNNPNPDKEALKNNMVQECEVICITTADNAISVPCGVNHHTKSMSGEETESLFSLQAAHAQVCLQHLSQKIVKIENSVIKDSEVCSFTCSQCKENSLCDSCIAKGVVSLNQILRPCSYCLTNEIKCIKLSVLGVSMDSESRNQVAHDKFKERKLSGKRDRIALCETFPDAVHVGKRKRQSFSNWFLFVGGERTNLVLLRTLRNDPLLRTKLCSHVRLNSVRNRDRQDVESLVEIGSDEVRAILSTSVKNITHTIVPEKYRVTKDNTKYALSSPVSICCGTMGIVYVSDVQKGTVISVRVSHYPAEVLTVVKSLKNPIALAFLNGVLYIAECSGNRIRCVDVTGETILRLEDLNIRQLKNALEKLGVKSCDTKSLNKASLKSKLKSMLEKKHTDVSEEKNCDFLDLSSDIEHPSSLSFLDEHHLLISNLEGVAFLLLISYHFVRISGTILKAINLPFRSTQSSVFLGNRILFSSNALPGGILKIDIDGDYIMSEDSSILVENNSTYAGIIQSMAIWKNDLPEIIFTDSERRCIKVLNIDSRKVEPFVGDEGIDGVLEEHDGCQGSFAQPTGICIEFRTVYVIDSAARKLKMVTSSNGMTSYLYNLDKFCKLFAIHRKNKKPKVGKIDEIIVGLEEVIQFDQECINDVKRLYGLKDGSITQGPHGTVSAVVLKDEERIRDGLRNLRAQLEDLAPQFLETFDIRSILTLCAENVFSEMRAGGLDMPLQLDFDRKCPKTVRERLKRQCHCSFDYFTHADSYYPKVSSKVQFNE